MAFVLINMFFIWSCPASITAIWKRNVTTPNNNINYLELSYLQYANLRNEVTAPNLRVFASIGR